MERPRADRPSGAPTRRLLLTLGGLLLVAAACLGAGAGSAPAAADPPTGPTTPPQLPPPLADDLRLFGEFGLAVHVDQDSVEVRWMTRDPSEGFLRAMVEGEVVHEVTTPEWISHLVTFPHPVASHPEASSILLSFGAADDPEDRHETRVHLDLQDRHSPIRIEGVDSLFVIADIHGQFNILLATLANAGLIDDDLRWSGGRSHLAVLGDNMGRGPDVTRVLWFLYGLERQAEEAGGRVHVTLGNHEIMVMLNDLRYVHEKEAWIAESHGMGYDRLFDPRRSVLGRWLASKPAVIQVDDALMTHGGVSGEYLDYTLDSLRDTLVAFMEEDLFYFWADTTKRFVMDSAAFERRWEFFWDERSTFWYRGYAQSDTLGDELAAVLNRFGSEVHVVGHTPAAHIQEAYDGRLVMVNVFPFAGEILLRSRTPDGYEHRRIPAVGDPLPLEVRAPIPVADHPADTSSRDPP
jgi:hypothetical protein